MSMHAHRYTYACSMRAHMCMYVCTHFKQVVPCEQTCHFAETARAAGNDVAQLIFEGAVHGGGAVNCAAGRQAILAFLRHHHLLSGPVRPLDDPRDAIGGAMRAFNLEPVDFEPVDGPFRPELHQAATLRYKPTRGALRPKAAMSGRTPRLVKR